MARVESGFERAGFSGSLSAIGLLSATKPIEFTAIPLRRFAFPQHFDMGHRFTLFGHFQPQRPARLCLAVERLRNRRRAAHFTENQDLHLKDAARVLDFQQIAGSDFPSSLGLLSVRFNPAQFTSSCGKRACLEESGGPKPFVHSYAVHSPILVPGPVDSGCRHALVSAYA